MYVKLYILISKTKNLIDNLAQPVKCVENPI